MMLTLREMIVSGNSYGFHAPTGADATVTLQSTGDHFVWHGNIGAITNDQIVDSALDSTPGSFWFTYRARPGSSPTSTSCSR